MVSDHVALCRLIEMRSPARCTILPWQQRLPVLNRRHHCQHPQMPRRPLQHAQEPPTFFPPSHDPSFSKSESQTSAVAESSQESFNAILPFESAASYNAILPLESDASTSMSLDDPDLLLSLINTGEIEVVASAGSPEACGIAPISSSSLNLSKVNETSVESMWNEAVESIFLPPTPAPQKPAKKSKAKTSHRILTATELMKRKENYWN